jgi:2-keto-4-pentenoate hydratase/2-oxohepta-3-ene-1,7-dioic acid hydratase in catechol pathway
MRIIRYLKNGRTGYGELRDDGSVVAINGDPVTAAGQGAGPGQFSVTRRVISDYKLLAPVAPTAIICIGLNYRRHAEEGKQPLPEHPIVFMKLPAALQHPDDPIVLPRTLRSDKVDYECELAVVIGKPARNVKAAAALDHVLGYTCGNDVSARDWQMEWGGGQWCRGKTFDTFAPLGPALVTTDQIRNPNALQIKTTLNGNTMQDWNTEDMIFDVPTLIEFLSGSTTLQSGTVVMTGTPHGVGSARSPQVFLQPGDTVTVSIDGIGDLTNPVVAEAE